MDIKTNMDLLNRELRPAGVRLVAVSKTHAPERIREAYEAGQRIFGENRVQELVPKYEALPKDIEWHLIGHLQTNKVKYIVPFVSLIHAVDSLKLLQEINKQGGKINRVVPCLLQVYIAQEETKYGWDRAELLAAVQQGLFRDLPFVDIRGLMGVASLTDNVGQIEAEMQLLEDLFYELQHLTLPANMKMKELSLGMSSDYRIAMRHGTTLVRLGSAIFGNRNYPKP
jgi:pyridoxal phosphate enzyme (YggS family)